MGKKQLNKKISDSIDEKKDYEPRESTMEKDFNPKGLYNPKDKSETQEKLERIMTKEKIAQYTKWYQTEYEKQIQFEPMPNISNTAKDYTLGNIIRMGNITSMKNSYYYNSMDMIVIVMKLYDYVTKQETNYGTVFCEITSSISDIQKLIIKNEQIYGSVALTFYSASPSYISCDGEYRSQFSRFKNLVVAKQIFPDIWNDIEEYVSYIRVRRQWSPYTSYFYPKFEQELKNTEVEYVIKNELIPITILIVSWFNTIFEEMLNMTKTHINPKYKEIFLREKEADIKFLKSIISKYGKEKIELFQASLISTRIPTLQKRYRYIHCGYKMIPLNIKEVQDPIRIKYKPWREYLVSNKCNDLVVNSICPSFAIILDWFYIKNSRKGLYDNKSQYDRMKNSELAKSILQILYEAQRGTYFATENLKTVNKSSGQIKQWINSKFKKLSEKIEDPINYSIEEIIMSEVTLSFANEYVGRTFADAINLTQTSKVFDEMIGRPFQNVGYDFFAKYLFDICYGLLCINTKLGLMHGDFHLNNATIGSLYRSTELSPKQHRVVYALDDEYQFVFPNNGYFGCLIDFSRSIINPHTYNIFMDKSLPSTYQLVKNEEKFISNEILSLLNIYIQMFPGKIKQKDELIVLFKNHYDVVFKLLTCIDLYMFTVRLNRQLKQQNMGSKAMELVDKINKLSEHYIASEMNKLVSDFDYAEEIEKMEFPIATIIKKCFAEYVDNVDSKDIITDVYCFNNEMKYSLDKYDNFPTIIKQVKCLDDDGKEHDIKYLSDMRRQVRLEYERIKTHNLEMVNYIALRHSQKML